MVHAHTRPLMVRDSVGTGLRRETMEVVLLTTQ